VARNETNSQLVPLRRLESDLDRELQYHIDRRVADLMHSGLPEAEARRLVALELGGATQIREEVRDFWLTRWLRDFVYDLRLSARSFLRSPSFTVTAVLSVALGIGATTAIYSLIEEIASCSTNHNELRRRLSRFKNYLMSSAIGPIPII
jgi:hypothetical protein